MRRHTIGMTWNSMKWRLAAETNERETANISFCQLDVSCQYNIHCVNTSYSTVSVLKLFRCYSNKIANIITKIIIPIITAVFHFLLLSIMIVTWMTTLIVHSGSNNIQIYGCDRTYVTMSLVSLSTGQYIIVFIMLTLMKYYFIRL